MTRRFRGGGDEVVGWLALEQLDLRAADPATGRAVAEAARRLCSATDASLCFLAVRRRVASAVTDHAPADRVRHALGVAMSAHRAAKLGGAPAFRTHAFVGIAAPSAQLRHRVDVAREILGACGVVAAEVEPPDHIAAGGDEHWDGIAGDAGYVTALELARLPGAPVQLGWLAPLLGAPVACDVAFWFEPVSHAVAHRVLERRMRGLTATRMLDADRGRIGDARADAGIDAAAALRERLARNEVRPLHAGVVVVAAAPDPVAARRDAQTLVTAAGGIL